MAQRIKIGIIFNYNEGWIGGTYYFLNLIHALKRLDDTRKPFLVILSKKEKDFEMVKTIEYPFIKYKQIIYNEYGFFESFINKISWKILKKKLFKMKALDEQIDIIFRGVSHEYFRRINHKLFWIPDFQEDYLPDFFSRKEIKQRKNYQRQISNSENPVVFSSLDAHNDYKRLYPEAKTTNFILNFSVTHPKGYKDLDIKSLKNKFNLKGDYFFCPNQFWRHKNHLLVLKALNLLNKKKRLNFQIAFSGKEEDYRNLDYFSSLKTYVDEKNLNENVRFLGFIDRKEQLQLMNHAKAIIQPSLFEGWSTVVEDAKAMNQNIIASDLKVHEEQLENMAWYFDRNNEKELEVLLSNIMNVQTLKRPKFEYENNVEKFGNQFIEIVENIVEKQFKKK